MKLQVMVPLLVTAAACGGGMVSVRATDGTETHNMSAAVRASAAHDLSCPAASVDVQDASANNTYEFVATGCGFRSTYRVPVHSIYETAEVVQMSRFAVAPPVRPTP